MEFEALRRRKRSPRACLACRARKVRCDVSQRGTPCTNCTIDEEACTVAQKRRNPSRNLHEARVDEQSNAPENSFEGGITHDLADIKEPEGSHLETEYRNCLSRGLAVGHEAEIHTRTAYSPSSTSADAPQPEIPSSYGYEPAAQGHYDGRQKPPACVSFTYYPFLSEDNLYTCAPQNINFLESEGCFRLPIRAILDQFIEQYFLHVHPLLPILNENDFWDMYHGQNPNRESRISLFVLQAMLFASCNFVSSECVELLNYPSVRSARAAFYRKAKLLYDFDVETSPVAIAQAALLLSYWTPSSNANKKPNSLWLTIAIHNARSAKAHRYNPRLGHGASQLHKKELNSLKRLWWCCVIRDRILSLGVRRRIQITKEDFDFEHNPRLDISDLKDEIYTSKVYDSDTKIDLIEILIQLVELCVILTETLLSVHPLHGPFDPGFDKAQNDESITRNKAVLRRWFNVANIKTSTGGGVKFQHESAIMYKDLMYTYYNSARLALSNHQLLCLVATSGPSKPDERSRAQILQICTEIQDATTSMTRCLEGLSRLQLTRWLPISAVAYTAFPLALDVLNVYFSTSSNSSQPKDPMTLQNPTSKGPSIFLKAWKTFHSQYDGVDGVAEMVRDVVRLVHSDPPRSKTAINNWAELLLTQPWRYLQFSVAVDLGLSTGELPDSDDLPAKLRELFYSRYGTRNEGFPEVNDGLASSDGTKSSTKTPESAHAEIKYPIYTGTEDLMCISGTMDGMGKISEDTNRPSDRTSYRPTGDYRTPPGVSLNAAFSNMHTATDGSPNMNQHFAQPSVANAIPPKNFHPGVAADYELHHSNTAFENAQYVSGVHGALDNISLGGRTNDVPVMAWGMAEPVDTDMTAWVANS